MADLQRSVMNAFKQAVHIPDHPCTICLDCFVLDHLTPLLYLLADACRYVPMHIASCCLRRTTPNYALFKTKNSRTKFWKWHGLCKSLQSFVLCHSPWQAIFLEIGSAARFMRLEKKEHMTLWNAILKSDLDTFSQVKEKLPFCTKFPWTYFPTAVAVSKQENLKMSPARCEHARKKTPSAI